MITETNPAEWWKKAREVIIEPIELEEDNQGNSYAPIECVIERLNQVFGPFWDVEIRNKYFEELTDEVIVEARVTFRTPEGLPNIVKDVIGRDDVVRNKYDKDRNKVEKYKDRPIQSLGDTFAGARSNAIKRAAKDLEVALRFRFQNPALNKIEGNKPTRNTSNTKKTTGKSDSGYRCDDCRRDINEKVSSYSKKFYGKQLCISCQKKNKKIK